MKLIEIITELDGGGLGRGIPASGPDASRATPTSALSKWGIVNSPLPHQFGKGRDWWEQKEKKKKKRRKLKDLEAGLDRARTRPY